MQPKVTLAVLTNSLPLQVWIALGFVLICSIIIGPILFSDFGKLIEMMSLMLGISLPREPPSFFHKVFLITWAIMSYILAQFYLASLAK